MSDLHGLRAALADRYELLRELGAGGMATVYLARDVRHAREVAIKVLHPELAAVLGAERFLSEIRTTASLQHPHILPLFDSGEAAGQLFYVMPFVDGETLRSRLEREKQLPIADAVLLAREVADALQYAHDRGVIHRDIKPENILLQGGHALVADFGIALAVTNAGGARMTQTGLSLGTPQYMAPEQAMGERTIDARADVYALGAVTYEMLAGEPPFTGPTSQAIVAKVLTGEAPALTSLRKAVPPGVAQAVHRAIERLPADRWASPSAFVAAFSSTPDVEPHASRSPARATRWRRALMPLALAVAAAGGYLLARRGAGRDGADPPVAQFVLSAPPSATPTITARSTDLDISPDGRRVVYLTGSARRLYVRALDSLAGTELPETDGATNPVFSPDGEWIAFVRGSRFYRVSVRGKPLVPLAEFKNSVQGLSWEIPDTLMIGSYEGLWTMPSAPGASPTAVPARAVDTTVSAHRRYPAVLPGGRGVIFGITWGASTQRLGVLDRTTGRVTILAIDGSNPRWSPSGHVVYSANGMLWALPFDAATLRVAGDPLPVLSSVAAKSTGAGNFAIARAAGTLVYQTESAVQRSMVWIDPSGRMTGVEGVPSSATLRDPRVSPDGQQLVYGDRGMLFLHDLRRHTSTQLTAGGDYAPVFMPDGRVLLFTSTRSGAPQLYQVPVDGTARESPFDSVSAPVDRRPLAVTADGQTLLAAVVMGTGMSWLQTEQIANGRGVAHRVLAQGDKSLDHAAFSPDGRWVTYRNGREIDVARYPEMDQRQQLSDGTGFNPLWSPDGGTVYYQTGDSLLAVAVQTRGALRAERPRLVTRAGFLEQLGGLRLLHVAPDGRIVAVITSPENTGREASDGQPSQVMLVQGWSASLGRRLGTRP